VLRSSEAQGQDLFGTSVAICREIAVVGANGEDGGVADPNPSAGAVYVFYLDGNVWMQADILRAPDAQPYDEFGTSVDVSGDHIIIGAYDEDGGPGNSLSSSGAAYLFANGKTGWEAPILHASEAQFGDAFGVSVALCGHRLIACATSEDGGAGDPLPDAGAAYIFE
jgi:hypothetical protein